MDDEMITTDPIDEIYVIRRRISERYGHDIHRYLSAMRELHKDDAAKGIKCIQQPIGNDDEPFKYPDDSDKGATLWACESSE